MRKKKRSDIGDEQRPLLPSPVSSCSKMLSSVTFKPVSWVYM